MKPLGKGPHFLILAALFGSALFVYVRTLCPTVYWEDAGELITVSHVLGIAHPPGHPLYTILGHLFTLIPLGTIAARVNFMSAFFGALASALVYPTVLCLLQEKTDNLIISHCSGAMAALFAAFGLTLWDQAVVAETSTLHAFFFMVLLLLFIAMLRAPDDSSFARRLLMFSFVYGLSLTNHLAGVLLLPAFGLWALVNARNRKLSFRNTLLSVLCFLVGLSVYLYLPIRSAWNPVIDWGNPETLPNFGWVITAGQFRGDILTIPSTAEMLKIAGDRLSSIQENFLGVGVVFILIGVWSTLRGRKDFLLFASVATATLFIVTLNPAFISAYFIPAFLLLAVFLGLGATVSANSVVVLVNDASLKRTVAGSICTILLLTPMLPLIRHYPMNDRSAHFHARDYGLRILEALPPNAVLFTIDLNAMFSIWYLTYCEGIRKDVLVVEPTWLTNWDSMREELLQRYPELLMPEVGEKIVSGDRLGETSLYDKDFLLAVLRKNSEVRPVYWGAMPIFTSLRPRGLIYEFCADGDGFFDKDTITRNKDFWESVANEFQRTPTLANDRVARLVYPENLRHQGNWFWASGREQLARWAFELAVRMNPGYSPAWLRLGELCRSEGEYEDALRFLDTAASLDRGLRPRALFARGHIFYETGRHDRAVEEFSLVISEKPRFPGAHNMLGALYLRDGDIERAEQEFRAEIRANPAGAAAYSNLGQILIQKAELDEAEKILEAGIEADAGMWQNFFFLAIVNSLRGKRVEAAELMGAAVGLGGQQAIKAGRLTTSSESMLGGQPGSEGGS